MGLCLILFGGAMLKNLLVLLLWCRVEPVIPNGDDYLRESNNIQSACEQALEECENHYPYCKILGCGVTGDNLFTERCDLIQQI